MNAEKAKRKPAKVKGAVLIMILAVMTVMIILLAGCIAVVYSTYNRVTVKYQENQAYYTMRSTLDVVYNDIMNSTELAPAGIDAYYYEGGSDPIKKLSGGPGTKLKRGRYEECALYQVPINTETTGNNANQWYADKVTAGDITSDDQVNILASDFTAANTGITDTELPNYAAQYGAKKWTTGMVAGVDDTVIYTVDMSTIADMAKDSSGNVVGKMLDADAGVNTATVKFQVLERMYDLGGSASDPIAKRFLLGDRKKDYFRIKATCEIDYDGEHCEYSVFYATKAPDPKINGVSSLSKMNPGSKIRMINEANSLENTTYDFKNNSVTTGDVALFGDLLLSASGTELVIEDGQVLMVTGSFNGGYNSNGVVFAETGATLYCKNASLNKSYKYKDSTVMGNVVCSDSYVVNQESCKQQISLFANNYIYNDANPPFGSPSGTNWYNNIYITAGESNFIDVSGTTVKAKRALRDVLGNSTFSGRIYFGSMGASGTATDFNVTSSYCFSSSIASPGEVVYSFVSDTIASDTTDHTVTYDVTKVLKLDYDSDAVLDTSTYKKKIALPSGAVLNGGSTVLELKTHRYIFNDRFDDSGTWNSDGSFVSTNQAFLWSHLLSRKTVPAATPAYATGTGVPGIAGGTVKILKDPSNSDLTNPANYVNQTFSSVITNANGTLELKGNYGGDILFDTTAGDINVVFNDCVKGRFYVTGDNTLNIYLTSPDGSFDLGGTDHQFILIDFNTINISTHSINMLAGSPRGTKTQLYVCDDSSGNPLVTTLTLYKLDSSGVGGISPVVCAQIDAPKTNLTHNSSGGTNISFTVPSGYTTQAIPIAIMGSVFTNSFQAGEDRGIWSMIPPDDPGDKTVNLVQRYR